MSFGSGSIPGYLERLRKTKNRRAKRQKEFKGGNDYSKTKSVKTEYDLPKPTSYNLSDLKRKIIERAKDDQKKQILLWLITIVLPLIIGFAIFLLY